MLIVTTCMGNSCSPGFRWWCLRWRLFCAVLFPTRCLGWDLGINWVSFWGFFFLLILCEWIGEEAIATSCVRIYFSIIHFYGYTCQNNKPVLLSIYFQASVSERSRQGLKYPIFNFTLYFTMPQLAMRPSVRHTNIHRQFIFILRVIKSRFIDIRHMHLCVQCLVRECKWEHFHPFCRG